MINHTVRRVNNLANALKVQRYLEIGVEKGETLFNVDAPFRVGVDPHFRFDPKAKETESLRLCQMTSDDYFIHHRPEYRFDIIFLDGLHTFEQTLRDLLNCLSFVHDRSIIIIDDVWPIDVFSACREHADAIRFRAMLIGREEQSWHGDVYKLIFFVHDFLPSYNFRVIKGDGNPQLILYKKARSDFSPKFNALEKIERLSYFDMLNLESLMKIGTEQEVLKEVISNLSTDRDGMSAG